MAYFLGVDAGGTKTEFLLGDERGELGRVRSGSIKRLRSDAETAARHLEGALAELAALTGVPALAVTRSCVGAAGSTVPLVAGWIREAFGRQVGGDLVLVGDVEIALDAAFQGGRGVLVLAGTGSNVAGRGSARGTHPDGSIVTAGGWGPAVADEGSGHFLGIEGVRRALRAIDEERPTLLLEAIQKHWQLTGIDELLERANATTAPDFSQLAPLVVECAAQGDVVAVEVIRRAGEELAALAVLVIKRLRRAEAASGGNSFVVPPVAFAGSILGKVALAREAVIEALRRSYPEIEIRETAVDPVQGALWRARQELGTKD
jgi:glucosamine kinase